MYDNSCQFVTYCDWKMPEKSWVEGINPDPAWKTNVVGDWGGLKARWQGQTTWKMADKKSFEAARGPGSGGVIIMIRMSIMNKQCLGPTPHIGDYYRGCVYMNA